MSLKNLPIDLYPDVSLPTVVVHTIYSGAGPPEIESEVSSISGIQKVFSQNVEGVSIITIEFTLKTNLNFAEQEVRAKVSNAMRWKIFGHDETVV